jgi:hypothetical protein
MLMFEDRSSVSERLRVLRKWLRHDADCNAAAWEQRNQFHTPNYPRPNCTCGLDDALLSVEVHASTGEGLRERVDAAEALLRAVMMKPAPGFDDTAYRVFRDSPSLLSVADVLRDVAAALPSPPASTGWQPIETAPKDEYIIGALIRDGVVWRVHEMKHNGLAFYTKSGGSLPRMTHWMPLPAPSSAAALPSPPTPAAPLTQEKE